MAKEAQESPADRLKREQAEAAAAAVAVSEAEKAEAAKNPAPTPEEIKAEQEAVELEKAKAEKFARAEAFEREREEKLRQRNATLANEAPKGDGIENVPMRESPTDAQITAGRAASDKLHKIGQALPASTPGEHVLFGLGGQRFTAGDLRALLGMR